MTATTSTQPPPGFGEPDAEDLRQPGLPPIMPIAIGTLILIVIGGIVVVAQYGRVARLAIPSATLGAAALLLLVNVVLLTRVKSFAWSIFFRVFGWAVLAYAVITGILAYTFIFDHTPARLLLLFGAMLLLFALDVPLMLAYSVARWQPVDAT